MVRWLLRAQPTRVSRVLRTVMLAGGGLALIILAVTGRLPLLFALLGGAMPFLQRLARTYRAAQWVRNQTKRQEQGPSSDQQASHVETNLVKMTLDHATSTLTGTVLQGPFKGRLFSELTSADLLELLAEAQSDDEQAVPLIETYLDRVFPQWREEAQQQGNTEASANPGAMTAAQAYEILGLQPGASREKVKDAHRRLMQKLHPDRGGSSFLAAQINKAKDILFEE